MEYRLLGRTGVRVAPLALGTFNFANLSDEAESERMLLRAIELGITIVDTADSYNNGASEALVGRVLAEHGLREAVLLATKVHFPMGAGPNERGNSRLHIMRAVEASLRRLRTDHIDLYQVHRPDPDTPVEETLGALTDLVRQGKVRYIGCSTHPAWQVMEALAASERLGLARYATEQPPYNLLDRRIENELVPLALRHGLGLICWAPLAQGVLGGRYNNPQDVPADSRAALRGGVYADRVNATGIAVAQRFAALAQQAGLSPAQLAILWAKDQPGITAPIFGPRSVAQLEQIAPVMELRLADELRAACDELVPPGGAVANFHNSAAWMKWQRF
jgi:1-deoxyxylulose-5-phosphate synthase